MCECLLYLPPALGIACVSHRSSLLQVLCIVPLDWFRWAVVSIAFVISSSFLLRNMWNYSAIQEERKVYKTILLVTMLGIHFAIAVSTKLYFFTFSSDE